MKGKVSATESCDVSFVTGSVFHFTTTDSLIRVLLNWLSVNQVIS